MKILLLGKNGQLGWELQRSLAPLGEVIGLDRHGATESKLCGDLTDLQGLAETVRHVRPDVIVNAAAYTAVDKAESEPELAYVLNTRAPEVLAQEAAKLGALFVHYSTDYVFDGSGSEARTEADDTAPLNAYGQSKRDGELRIQAVQGHHLILRTSWVYAARGDNFAKTMLRLGQEREQLTVIDDQWGAPTGADLLADVSAHAIRQIKQGRQEAKAALGLFHVVAAGTTNWHGYARHVIAEAQRLRPELRITAREIVAVPSSAFPTPARRPLNSRLDARKFEATFGITLPHWQQGVDRMLAEVLLK
jgi:dTDP-4-dehydrorhamnose reductase